MLQWPVFASKKERRVRAADLRSRLPVSAWLLLPNEQDYAEDRAFSYGARRGNSSRHATHVRQDQLSCREWRDPARQAALAAEVRRVRAAHDSNRFVARSLRTENTTASFAFRASQVVDCQRCSSPPGFGQRFFHSNIVSNNIFSVFLDRDLSISRQIWDSRYRNKKKSSRPLWETYISDRRSFRFNIQIG